MFVWPWDVQSLQAFKDLGSRPVAEQWKYWRPTMQVSDSTLPLCLSISTFVVFTQTNIAFKATIDDEIMFWAIVHCFDTFCPRSWGGAGFDKHGHQWLFKPAELVLTLGFGLWQQPVCPKWPHGRQVLLYPLYLSRCNLVVFNFKLFVALVEYKMKSNLVSKHWK